MAVPDFQSLMLPVLSVAADGVISVADARDRIAAKLVLSEADLDEKLPSGRQTVFVNRVSWARIFLERAGLIDSPRRAHFEITERGRDVLAKAPPRIDIAYLRQFPEFDEWRRKSERNRKSVDKTASSPLPDAESNQTPEERIEAAHAELRSEVRAELLERMRESSPSFFEQIIVDLLVAMGYGGGRAEMGEAIGRGGDGGVDGVIKEDVLGLDAVYVQAKRYAAENSVGRPLVQAFVGSLEGFSANKGILVTTSTFTKDAIEYAGRVQKRLVLIDGEQLAQLMVDHGVGVRLRANYEISRIDEDYFSE
jgi:restriction system protein